MEAPHDDIDALRTLVADACRARGTTRVARELGVGHATLARWVSGLTQAATDAHVAGIVRERMRPRAA